MRCYATTFLCPKYLPYVSFDNHSSVNCILNHTKIINFFINFSVGYINARKVRITEGNLRCEALAEYLEKIGGPRIVWLSEDGSGVVQKITYDSVTNQLVGLVLPLHSSTGMPISFSFQPKTMKDMHAFLKMPKSTTVQVMMAQPLKYGAPPFILQLFGTDNKHLGTDLAHRWEHTINELSKYVSTL